MFEQIVFVIISMPGPGSVRIRNLGFLLDSYEDGAQFRSKIHFITPMDQHQWFLQNIMENKSYALHQYHLTISTEQYQLYCTLYSSLDNLQILKIFVKMFTKLHKKSFTKSV